VNESRGRGQVASLNVSKGGVPKLPIERAVLGVLGLEGDKHRARFHGGPTAALCLFPMETVERLRAEGHPIYPGAIGENVTIAGIEWDDVKPGVQLRIGPTLVEVTRYTRPCRNIAMAFRDEDFGRVDAERHPGEARVYARVLEGGTVATGDSVELIQP
jgi:MOSC domain-containing protein YiiM